MLHLQAMLNIFGNRVIGKRYIKNMDYREQYKTCEEILSNVRDLIVIWC